ncbi:MAG: ATP synthase F1 subunit gamma [Chitinophagales bacterium]|jgi:F-type H+-transporting ATPase subunit gamma|nr:ATP synthase F1 subunit gamma [Sphingobacteriales bacterium]MBP9142255.1 ATP synthase F1 subunit gamma [Chitinophagales bacterium]MDA0199153.1 ATP synthase F1 subunit gamma [Bacteroidota bacterium]MBK8679385.1 ATP synthase F1 subunit gamma [Sphingobacteriales bacterium]MBL0246754.1 ATP synthase F1 subunit gamma [Sphingobacteriales bacterium]
MPGQLKEVRNRIVSVKKTQQITKAMKLVAASKLRKAQDRIIKIRPYADKLYGIMGNLMSGGDSGGGMAFGTQRPAENILIILVTSDRGLCGAFNSSISKMVRNTINTQYAQQKASGNVTLMFIGKKGYDLLKREPVKLNTDYINLFQDLNFDDSAALAELIMQQFLSKQYDIIHVAYNQFKNQIVQIPLVDTFLPVVKLEKPDIAKKSSAKNAGNAPKEDIKPDYLYEPDKEQILKELVPKILKTQFFRYLLDSNASEQGARMTSMDNATNNAEELLRDLSIQYNRARQAAITTEITEIVSGAAALQG